MNDAQTTIKQCIENQLQNLFPLLNQTTHGQPLVYLDNAATTQKPLSVIETVNSYYREDNANVHRGIYALSERATRAYESARGTVQKFIHAPHRHEIIFTKGATEAINLVAASFGELAVGSGDEILISTMEHHSNIVPWQLLCKKRGAHLKIIPMLDDGRLDMDAYQKMLTSRTKLVALIHISNVLGTINPVKDMVAMAHAHDIPVLLDGAQATPHLPVNVQDLDCDFYVFSSHKMYGPTGVGVLYGKSKWLEKMPPYQSGGDMIRLVRFEHTEFNELPYKFEAGTPNMAGVIGLAAAIDFLKNIGLQNIAVHEKSLTNYAIANLQSISGLKILGCLDARSSVISFVMKQAHPHDIGTILDSVGVAIRAGHHCAMPLMERLQVPATARVSIALYNTKADIDCLVKGLHKVIELFGKT